MLDPADGGGGVVDLVGQVGDGDVGAFAGEGDRDGAADAGVAAGDEGAHPVQTSGADIALFAVVGHGNGRLGEAGLLLLLLGEAVGAVAGHRIQVEVRHVSGLRRHVAPRVGSARLLTARAAPVLPKGSAGPLRREVSRPRHERQQEPGDDRE